ncbi:hypothetical protein WQ54_06320 [Bacillus sp. SA1-12]|uniref:hypothetical protein n=1 Tax=Bacillus sp. SA1-12 TaxID=1455638 RepID=UPI000626533C|nr:hypothetical protein [Bacillus sp. SA1-12]KKI93116.1 hypothetical protein WQ54_06320 [Bacillus sp. SA1-12]
MKRQDWNEEQLKQLLKQLPSVKDKQTSEDIYQSILSKQQQGKKSRTWMAPAIAAVAALFIFALLSPLFFQSFQTNEESSMDMSSQSTTEGSAKSQQSSDNNEQIAEARKDSENKELAKASLLNEKQDTFVTAASEEEDVITVGFTDSEAKNILPVSLVVNKKQDKLEQIEEVNPEVYKEELGPITYELSETEFSETGKPEEITIDYKGVPNLSSSTNDVLYQNAIIETFKWLNYKRVNLYTNQKEGIEFGQSGPKNNLDVSQETQKAYFLYQFDENTLKLLVPSPNSYDSIKGALDAMKQGIEENNLQPTILKTVTNINSIPKGDLLEIEFNQDAGLEDSEDSIIMLEAVLMTAKEFGYHTVQFKGIKTNRIGEMDVTKPIEVPFSPNPIKTN